MGYICHIPHFLNSDVFEFFNSYFLIRSRTQFSHKDREIFWKFFNFNFRPWKWFQNSCTKIDYDTPIISFNIIISGWDVHMNIFVYAFLSTFILHPLHFCAALKQTKLNCDEINKELIAMGVIFENLPKSN